MEEEENVEEKRKNVVPPEKKQRVGRKTSSVWDHYTMLPDCDPKKPRAACNYCGANYAADTKMNGTSTLWAHVERKCKKCPFSDWVEQGKRKQSTMDRFAKILTPNSEGGVLLKFNPNDVRKAIAEYITVDELSFRHVEGKGFQKFVHFFLSDISIPIEIYCCSGYLQCICRSEKRLEVNFDEVQGVIDHRLLDINPKH